MRIVPPLAAVRNDPARRPGGNIVVEINLEHEAAHRDAASAVKHALRCGELLLQAKAQIAHGDWLPWLSQHCSFSARSASGYMRLAQAGEADRQRVADFSLRRALRGISETGPRSAKSEEKPQKQADKKPEEKKRPLGPPCDGMQFARMAVMQLQQIRADDVERDEALRKVRGWIKEHETEVEQLVESSRSTGRGVDRRDDLAAGVQIQVYACLVDAWDEATDETRERFLLSEGVRETLLEMCARGKDAA